eukprot:TRINITY_DN15745_c0_g1_i1.p1 TRINITY_DN15745_c0_g1~~TRINITY_DN15745_c0_g1_i1.p1  ORF type:complete len:127 (-),score=9.19 TRINITY_DN15745_c0_g1_i1:427-807(-)
MCIRDRCTPHQQLQSIFRSYTYDPSHERPVCHAGRLSRMSKKSSRDPSDTSSPNYYVWDSSPGLFEAKNKLLPQLHGSPLLLYQTPQQHATHHYASSISTRYTESAPTTTTLSLFLYIYLYTTPHY